MTGQAAQYNRQWRDYQTAAGARPVSEFIDTLSDDDAACILDAMDMVAERGLSAAKPLRGDIYEVRAFCAHQGFRILFAPEGYYGEVLLALEGFSKKTQRTPPQVIDVAERRLRDWRERGEALRRQKREAGEGN